MPNRIWVWFTYESIPDSPEEAYHVVVTYQIDTVTDPGTIQHLDLPNFDVYRANTNKWRVLYDGTYISPDFEFRDAAAAFMLAVLKPELFNQEV